MKLCTNVGILAGRLSKASTLVFDFETSGLDPRRSVIAGLGVFVPEFDECFYINTGHFVKEKKWPLTPEVDLAAAVAPFFSNPKNHAIAHNLSFDVRLLFQLGVDVRCRTTCTLIQTHRLDENLRGKGEEPTTHPAMDFVSYGLKRLMRIFFNEIPPTILDATQGRNTLGAPPSAVGCYCVQDCLNTWRLYQRNHDLMSDQENWLLENIDDPNNLVIARMMWDGLGVDMDEARQQQQEYELAIERCREEIWKIIGSRPLFGKTADLKRFIGDMLQRRIFSLSNERVKALITGVATTERQRKILALLVNRQQMRQRLAAFLRPIQVITVGGRIYASRFSSTLVTTRFSSSPNLQNLPKHADKVDPDDQWNSLVPDECKPAFKTRNIITASPGHMLVELDYSAAEPRYIAALFQRAITEKDSWLRSERIRLRQIREFRYGQLIARMQATAKQSQFKPDEIEWPKYTQDPLWKVFKHGIPTNDPYNALLSVICKDDFIAAQAQGATALSEWFDAERWRGKKAWLALAYGSKADALAPALKWSLDRTNAAITALETEYAMLNPLRELTWREVMHLGKVQTLWGRQRRLNGYIQLAGTEPVKVRFKYRKPVLCVYEAEIIPLASFRRGVQAFVKDCWYVEKNGKPGVSVLRGTNNGMIGFIDERDTFVIKDHFNRPPFRNIPYSVIDWVQEENGLIHHLGRQERAVRQAFNFRAQGCGADHLRWTMNAIAEKVCKSEAFNDCRLVLTVHDSLCYEVPEEKVEPFVAAIRPVATARPSWCDFDIAISVEVGKRMGELVKV